MLLFSLQPYFYIRRKESAAVTSVGSGLLGQSVLPHCCFVTSVTLATARLGQHCGQKAKGTGKNTSQPKEPQYTSAPFLQGLTVQFIITQSPPPCQPSKWCVPIHVENTVLLVTFTHITHAVYIRQQYGLYLLRQYVKLGV